MRYDALTRGFLVKICARRGNSIHIFHRTQCIEGHGVLGILTNLYLFFLIYNLDMFFKKCLRVLTYLFLA